MEKYLIFSIFFVVFVNSLPSRILEDEDHNRLHYLYFPTPEQQVEIVYNDTRSLRTSNLKPGTKTILLIDGFTAPPLTPMNQETKNTYSGRDDMNVIIVDWSAYSGYGRPIGSPEQGLALYMEILTTEIPKAGEDLADFIEFLCETVGISYNNIVLIGHSLGAHTCSATGRATISKYNSTIGRIIALDAALQISSFDAPRRLRIGDAQVVELYTTNRKVAGDNYPATADITVYVNGGNDQPCQGLSEDIGILCDDHGFSWKLYNYLAKNDTIKACPCRGAACFCGGSSCPGFDCGADGISVGPHIPESARGSYHLKTGHLQW